MTKRAATYFEVTSLQAEAGEQVALCAAQALPEGDEVPDWIPLLPAGGELRTHDNRGPYKVRNLDAIIARSLQAERGMVLDENHSNDVAARQGLSSPARGWITGLEVRDGVLMGKVDWTPTGRALMADKAYRFISPAVIHDARTHEVLAIARASLVNRPNLRGMPALHQEDKMDLLAKLIAALGLDTSTSEDALVAAVTSLHAEQAEAAVALQAQLDPIAEAAGLKQGATVEAVLGAIGGLKTSGGNAQVVALQAELAEVTTKLNALDEQTRRDKATSFIDGAIAAKTVGIAPLRDHYITRHMEDAAAVEKEVGAMPRLGRSHTEIVPPAAKSGELTADQRKAIALMGISEEDFKKTLAAEGAAEATL